MTIIIASTWEDEQFGPMFEDTKLITSVAELKAVQDDVSYCLYKTELEYAAASEIILKYVSSTDLSNHEIFYLTNENDSDTWEEDEAREIADAERIFMSENKTPLAQLSKAEYKSLQKLGILQIAYPDATGKFLADCPCVIPITAYLHGDKESYYETGEDAGLTGTALDEFQTAGYEHTIVYAVNTNTGDAKVLSIDGMSVVSND